MSGKQYYKNINTKCIKNNTFYSEIIFCVIDFFHNHNHPYRFLHREENIWLTHLGIHNFLLSSLDFECFYLIRDTRFDNEPNDKL